ncbi:unnamed protein product [Brassica oleracea var. botrytis]
MSTLELYQSFRTFAVSKNPETAFHLSYTSKWSYVHIPDSSTWQECLILLIKFWTRLADEMQEILFRNCDYDCSYSESSTFELQNMCFFEALFRINRGEPC